MATVLAFHHRLCAVRVLDPACGSGNFLYVTLEHLKRLEGEVLNALDELDYRQAGLAFGDDRADAMGGETVDPHNLLGIELNPRAAAIAEVVLWIGYLQWHFRTRGNVPPAEPVVRDFRNIENRDAVLAHDGVELVYDEHGVPVTRWDGVSYKTSPVTGEQVPDETARKPQERYLNPRQPVWPEADFIVGNPPYIGLRRVRQALGEGYIDALRQAYPSIPDNVDFVMYWWSLCAGRTGTGATTAFGLITSNSIRQTFSRKVLEQCFDAWPQLRLKHVTPDHPWVDAADGAAVRVAMTTVDAGKGAGTLAEVVDEAATGDIEVDVEVRNSFGFITPNLTIAFDPAKAHPLKANSGMACVGYQLTGKGFVLDKEQLDALYPDGNWNASIIRPLMSGRDVTQSPRHSWAMDFYGLDEEALRHQYPELYQWIFDRVWPERSLNNRPALRQRWWIFGEARSTFRPALSGTTSALVTSLTAKYRLFVPVAPDTICDSTTVMFALPDPAHFGVLSSKLHEVWAVAAGGRLGVGNDPRYNKTRCFETFAFPAADAAQSADIAALAEQLDAHRKRQQAAHSGLTLTGMYNVLEALRSGTPLKAKERAIHEQALVSVLRQLHDELDAAVLAAYGWSDLLADLRIAHGNDPAPAGDSAAEARRRFEEAVLERLVALNAERAAEEARGHIRWLRPDFQNPQAAPSQTTLIEEDNATDAEEAAPAAALVAAKPVAWPKDPLAQVRAVAEVLSASAVPLDIDQVAARFSGRGPWKKRLPALLEMLVALGRARQTAAGYLAR